MRICCNLQENAIKLYYACKSPAKVKCYTTYGVYATWRSESLTHASDLTSILKVECLSFAPGHEKTYHESLLLCAYVDIFFYIFTKYLVLSHTDAFVYRVEEM